MSCPGFRIATGTWAHVASQPEQMEGNSHGKRGKGQKETCVVKQGLPIGNHGEKSNRMRGGGFAAASFLRGGGGGRRPAPVAFLWYVCLQVSCLRPCLVANGWTVTPLAQTDGLFQSEVSVWLSKHVCDKQRHARFFGGLPPSSPIGSRCGTRRPPRRQGVLPPLPCSVPCRTCPCAERP